ncbi:MAG: TetR/AcrR family transcriptional regulator [Verrucomicrobiae bacterium]|nr:TetR/AcrR family transcriptional regulator [Verrucomicrobiae bacterium]
MAKGNSYDSILMAAEKVVLRDGAAHLTLDSVARSAKVSKGGVLYHFPSKESLLKGMVTRHIERFENTRQQFLKNLPPGPARELKASLLTREKICGKNKRLNASLWAALAHDPKAALIIKSVYQKGFQRVIAGGLPPEQVAVITSAIIGLRLMEALDISPFDASCREAMVKELHRLTDEAEKKTLQKRGKA